MPIINTDRVSKVGTKAKSKSNKKYTTKKYACSKKVDPKRDCAKQFLKYRNRFVEKFDPITTRLMQ